MAVIIRRCEERELGDQKGIKYWVHFDYNKPLIDKIKTIPGSYRTYDPETQMWGFNKYGWDLFCAISEVRFVDDLFKDSPTGYIPRKIDESLENLDWEKFRRPAKDNLPELYPWSFQKVAISQILRNKNHGLFLEVGLGKTYTAVCAAREALDRGEVKQVLIISLVAGVLNQWASLLDRMGYSYTMIRKEKMVDRPRVYDKADTEFVLTLYTSVLSEGPVGRSSKRKFSDVFISKSKKGGQMIVADELHKLGDVGSKTFKSFLAMSKAAIYRVPCTGTIIKSTPDKALLLLRFIAPNVFGNKGVFEEAFMVKEQGYFGPKVIGYKNLNRLKELIHSYGTVALKKDHLKDLPEVMPTVKMTVETSKDSLEVLHGIRGKEVLSLVQSKADTKYADLKDLYIRVHQALICPSIYSDKYQAKNMLEALLDILEGVDGKTLVFTTLRGAVDEISEFLKKKKVGHVVCYGGLKDSEMDSRVKKFSEDPDCQVMVATVQKMGTGYDTVKVAQNCVIYDFNMVAGDLKQAIGRVLRPGQQNKVSVFELVQDNVFSEYQREKVSIQEGIINQTEDSAMKVQDTVELSNLLKLAYESNLFGSD